MARILAALAAAVVLDLATASSAWAQAQQPDPTNPPPRADSSRNGALMGAGVGAGIAGAMFVYGLAVDRNEIDEWAPLYLGYGAAFTGIGALVGWAIDAAQSKSVRRFKAPHADARSVRMAPLLGRRKGIAVAVTF